MQLSFRLDKRPGESHLEELATPLPMNKGRVSIVGSTQPQGRPTLDGKKIFVVERGHYKSIHECKRK